MSNSVWFPLVNMLLNNKAYWLSSHSVKESIKYFIDFQFFLSWLNVNYKLLSFYHSVPCCQVRLLVKPGSTLAWMTSSPLCWFLPLELPARVKMRRESNSGLEIVSQSDCIFQPRPVYESEELLSVFQNSRLQHPRYLGDGPLWYLQLPVPAREGGERPRY